MRKVNKNAILSLSMLAAALAVTAFATKSLLAAERAITTCEFFDPNEPLRPAGDEICLTGGDQLCSYCCTVVYPPSPGGGCVFVGSPYGDWTCVCLGR